MTKKITLIELEEFISTKLTVKLQRDLRLLYIVKEADMECCAYYHLRKLLKGDSNWRILARKHAPKTGRFIDILIFRNKIPRIAIELKWNRKKISIKDRNSLKQSLLKLRVNKIYFMTTIMDSSSYTKVKKNLHEKYNLKEIPIGLDYNPKKYDKWLNERAKYRSEMKKGKKKF